MILYTRPNILFDELNSLKYKNIIPECSVSLSKTDMVYLFLWDIIEFQILSKDNSQCIIRFLYNHFFNIS